MRHHHDMPVDLVAEEARVDRARNRPDPDIDMPDAGTLRDCATGGDDS